MSYASEVLADSPTYYLRFGESSGSTAADSSGNGRNATLFGSPALGATGALSGDADTALDLDGTNDYARLAALSLGSTSQWTHEFWLCPDSSAAAHRHVFTDGTTYAISVNAGTLYVYRGGWVSTGVSAPNGEWHHWAIVCDNGASSVKVYKDGALAATLSVAGGAMPSGNQHWWGSNDVQTAGLFTDGKLDEATFYRALLIPARISAHFLAGKAQLADATKKALSFNPAALYLLDETTGTQAKDSSGNGRHGTHNGGVLLGQASLIDTDPSGYAAAYDGVDDYTSTPAQPFAAGSQRTFFGVTKRDGTGRDTLFGSSGGFTFLEIGNDAATTPYDVVFSPNWATTKATWADAWPHDTARHTWVLTFNDATDTCELYIDGVSKGTLSMTATYSGATATLRWGCWDTSWATLFLDGTNDLLGYTTSILTSTQVSELHQAIAAQPPANTVTPTVTGTVLVGQTLTGTDGTWTGGTPITYAYQWQRSDDGSTGWSDIGGATTASYLLPEAVEEKYVRLKVTATNSAGSATAYSNVVGPVPDAPTNEVAPALSGPAMGVLTTSDGTWDGTGPLDYEYEWQRSLDGETWTAIPGATSSSYELQFTDEGYSLRCAVLASNDWGSAASNSDTYGPVAVIYTDQTRALKGRVLLSRAVTA